MGKTTTQGTTTTTTTKRRAAPTLAGASTEQLRAELLARYQISTAGKQQPTRLHTPQAIFEHLLPMVVGLPHEEFHVLYIGSRNNTLLHHERVAVGGLDQCAVDPRRVFGPAVVHGATAIILAHNHPSGDPYPSNHDLAITRQFTEAGRLLCIRVLDHIIIGGTSYHSMLSAGTAQFR